MSYSDPDVFSGTISRPAAAAIGEHLAAYISANTIIIAPAGAAIDGVTVNEVVALPAGSLGSLGECTIFTRGNVPVKVGVGGVTADTDVMVGTLGRVVNAGGSGLVIGRSHETKSENDEARIKLYNRPFLSGASLAPLAPTAITADGAIAVRPSANYIITKAGVAALTLAAPAAGTDDGVTITVTSATANAHTITATNLLNTGAAANDVATFAAFAGAGLTLQAYNGTWNVLQQVGITFS